MTQPDIEVAVEFAIAQSGKPYTTHRPIEEYADGYDCSALVIAALIHMYHAVGEEPPADLLACSNTVDLYRWAQRHGYLVSVAKGIEIRGAIFIKGKWWGYGPLGHTSISLGGGYEMAAHGVRSGIHTSPLYGAQQYQDAFIINDGSVFYEALQPPVDPAVLEFLARLAKWRDDVTARPLRLGDTNGNVTFLNELLIAKVLLDPKAKSNTYTKATAGAVNHLKRLAGIKPTDGKLFGSVAAAALVARAS